MAKKRSTAAYAGIPDSAPSAQGLRGRPWRHYVCGLKHRTGAKSCEGSRIAAHTVDRHVMQAVLDQVLTPYYMSRLLQEVNAELGKDLEGIDREIRRKERKLASLHKGIESLLDLAEKAGSEAALARLVERETEKATLLARLKSLEAHKVQSHISLAPEALEELLAELRAGLGEAGTQQKRLVLQSFVQTIEVEDKKVRLTYTFPLPLRTDTFRIPLGA